MHQTDFARMYASHPSLDRQMAGSLFPIEGVLIANMQNNLYATDPDKVCTTSETESVGTIEAESRSTRRGGVGTERSTGRQRDITEAAEKQINTRRETREKVCVREKCRQMYEF